MMMVLLVLLEVASNLSYLLGAKTFSLQANLMLLKKTRVWSAAFSLTALMGPKSLLSGSQQPQCPMEQDMVLCCCQLPQCPMRPKEPVFLLPISSVPDGAKKPAVLPNTSLPPVLLRANSTSLANVMLC